MLDQQYMSEIIRQMDTVNKIWGSIPEDNFNQVVKDARKLAIDLAGNHCNQDEKRDKMLEYDKLVGILTVCVNQMHGDVDVKLGEDLQVSFKHGVQATGPSFAAHVSELVRAANFIGVFERRFKETLRAEASNSKAQLSRQLQERIAEYQKAQMGDTESISEAGSSVGKKEEPKSTRDQLLSTNQRITASLMRSNNVLKSSVLQSELNISELEQQTHSLQTLGNRFDALGGILTTSSTMIKAINNASQQEQRQIYASLGFLVLCMSWVLWRRIFKGPFKLIIWLWFRFFRSVLVTLGALPGRQRARACAGGSLSCASLVSHTLGSVVSSVAKTATTSATDFADRFGGLETAIDLAFDSVHDEL
ncbi:LAMI_0B06348g1_1 [Lachancea mirantina]|uniref:LAMI_0B06348g1_1 n=1 Tax=Lachancea mirantina TaxID=1230905 RepID=A0A1G4IWT9_9SACH|nr:LAMI_0B06348g1_1 [Lachancea mirantina]